MLVFMSVAMVTAVFLYALLALWLGKLFRGQAAYRQIVALTAASSLIAMVPSILSLLDTVTSTGISRIVLLSGNAVFNLWSTILFVVMLTHVEKFAVWKGIVVTLILGGAVGGVVAALNRIDIGHGSLDIPSYIQTIQKDLDNNVSAKKIAAKVIAGYEGVYGSDEAFLSYSDRLFDLFVKDPWQLVRKDLPDNYVEYLDRKLQQMLTRPIATPPVTLYTPDGETIEDANRSRRYFVSEVYKRIGEFYDEEQGVSNWALRYAEKGLKVCPDNPDLLFLASYYDTNATANVARYDRVLKLIAKSDALLDREISALYNNLGFQIWEANMTRRYDEAIGYLQKAYDSDHDKVYSLANIASILLERGEVPKAYQTLEKEVFRFLDMDRATAEEVSKYYWIFVRNIIGTSFKAGDYAMTKEVCARYLTWVDTAYEECLKDLDKIDKTPRTAWPTPRYPVWRHYQEHKAQEHVVHEENATDEDYEQTERFLREAYIPEQGQSQTVQGEMLRAALRLQNEA